jgi:hypothetical protein
MSENIAAFHGRLIAIEEVEIGSADGTGGNFNQGISRM